MYIYMYIGIDMLFSLQGPQSHSLRYDADPTTILRSGPLHKSFVVSEGLLRNAMASGYLRTVGFEQKWIKQGISCFCCGCQ